MLARLEGSSRTRVPLAHTCPVLHQSHGPSVVPYISASRQPPSRGPSTPATCIMVLGSACISIISAFASGSCLRVRPCAMDTAWLMSRSRP